MSVSPARSRRPHVYCRSSRANDGRARLPPEYIDPNAPFDSDDEEDDRSPSPIRPRTLGSDYDKDRLYEMKCRFLMLARETNDQRQTRAWTLPEAVIMASSTITPLSPISPMSKSQSIIHSLKTTIRKTFTWKSNEIAPYDEQINQSVIPMLPLYSPSLSLSHSTRTSYYDYYAADEDFGQCFRFLNRVFTRSKKTSPTETITSTRTQSSAHSSTHEIRRHDSMSSHMMNGASYSNST